MGVAKFLYKSLMLLFPLPSERKIKEIPYKDYAYFHASSMGEVMSLKPLVERFLNDLPCVVSVFTKSGKKRAEEFFKEKAQVLYFPLDKEKEIKKLIQNAKFIILAESEFWPNLLHIALKKRKKVFLVNGRISKRSFYLYNYIFKDIKKYLREFELLFLQDEKYKKFFKLLGIPEKKFIVLKNLKYDSIKRDVKPLFEKKDFIITFGSVRRDEVNIFMDAIGRILNKRRNLKIVIAPRHLINARFIESKLKDKGIEYEKRSERKIPSKKVFILDTLGELIRVWKISDVAVVGGTFGNHGGHNLAEPASFGVPVIFGRSVRNVKEVSKELLKMKGGIMVNGKEELIRVIYNLLENNELREKMGRNARKTVEKLSGSSKIIYRRIKKTLGL